MNEFDAVVIPGGGIDANTGLPQPWVCARLDAALKLRDQAKYFIVLSRGTTHKPPPKDREGFSIDEAAASAKYLLDNGIEDAERILMDRWSLDTIGNVFFARAMICDPMKLKRLCVITSLFHMPRTRTIFDWVFTLDRREVDIEYVVTPDNGMSAAQSSARTEKEQESLRKLVVNTIPSICSMGQLANFLFTAHGAYNAHPVRKMVIAEEKDEAPEKENSEILESTY
ncbi:hypothetical protein BWQ96_01980 [Gracilariopsis chorda]|uniref:DUF218 domain-containing protein n=1 Tax=Gracilariopsis chorda TaxID=448386 RepID=A0A2V3J1J3_9FLOR|nr:hypothetical protein BWQ96_01980 [Gracilariopsis chorda]|eukprot:PXF48291.1 hypothetical protein BWQ96_01980 [Gracilariopsis chorda]